MKPHPEGAGGCLYGYIDARLHRQDRGNLLHRTAGPYIGVTFEPLQTLVAVKLRSDCMSVLVGVAVKPLSELRGHRGRIKFQTSAVEPRFPSLHECLPSKRAA
jgi:hypothetical protein